MIHQQHTIENLRADVSGRDHRKVIKAQQQLSFLLNTGNFLQRLETVFDTLVPNGEYLEIRNLEISISDYREQQFQDTLLYEIEHQIKRRLGASTSNELKLLSKEDFVKATYTYFLRYGLLLYPAGKEALAALHHEILQLANKSSPFLELILKDLGKTDQLIWKRIYLIIGDEAMRQYCKRVYPYTQAFLDQLVNAYQQGLADRSITPGTLAGFWQQLVPKLIDEWPEKKLKETFFTNDGQGHTPGAAIMPQDERVTTATRDKVSQLISQGMVVSNAGMVLLWREFGQLLRKLEYVKDTNFIDLLHQQKAILLFNYLYTGSAEFEEETLLLNKLLCNWPLEEPVDPAYIPDQQACEAADTMLEDYITAWRKEHKYSVDWFRRSFLEREGRLVKRPDGDWTLEILNKAEDILINKVSIIKYSWMHAMLFVSW